MEQGFALHEGRADRHPEQAWAFLRSPLDSVLEEQVELLLPKIRSALQRNVKN